MAITQRPCPCGSKKLYNVCCEPVINLKRIPETAEELMRARYTAHVKSKFDFVQKTTHPSTRGRHDMKNVKNWAESVVWKRLEILNTLKGKANDTEGIVEFQAWHIDDNGLQCLREKSNFAKVAGQWFYVEGEHFGSPKMDAHQYCPCGSGLKYGDCCG